MDVRQIGRNIRRLRRERKLSQASLVATIDLSLSGFRKIEQGKSTPRPETVAAIAESLAVPVRLLYEPSRELKHVRFRAHKDLRSREQILVDVARWLHDYSLLEKLMGEQSRYSFQGLAEALPDGEQRPIVAAQKARACLGLAPDAPIRDLCGVLESAGIKIMTTRRHTSKFFGLSVGAGDGGPAICINTWERISVERWIFSAAHELGHLLLHLDTYGDAQSAFDGHDDAYQAQEREADVFAGEFLMPDAVFQQEWQEAYGLPFVDRVLKVKRIFHVSYKTVLLRLANARPKQERPDLYKAFYQQYHAATGRSLRNHREPEQLEERAFFSSIDRAEEPDTLCASDFREDRLAGLVRRAIEDEVISRSRGAEILGLSITKMRVWAASEQ